MSYDLCLSPQTEKPYYIESIRTEIYSLEELCFYFYNNICLIDESVMNETLCCWIRDELKLTRLYRQLNEQLEKKEGAASFVMPIFKEAGYLENQEMHQFQERLTKLEIQSDDMKQKLRGDYLVKEKMYGRAIREYRCILKRKNPGKLGAQFYAAVWNNLGAAYAGLFQFESAGNCFWEAYSLTKTRETFRKYISALPLYMAEKDYKKRLEELEEDAFLVQKIQEYNAAICSQTDFRDELERTCSKDPDLLIRELKEQYCRSTKI